jgi:hypothetical protein
MAADGARHAEKPARTPVASGQRRAVATTMGAPKRRCHPLRDPNPVSGSSTLWMGWATRHADGRRARPFLRANSGVPELGCPDLRGTADCRRRHVAHAGLRQRAGSGRTRRQAATATTATTTSPERQDAPPTRGARPERRVHPHCTGAAAQQVSDVAPVLDPEANGELRIAPVSRRGPSTVEGGAAIRGRVTEQRIQPARIWRSRGTELPELLPELLSPAAMRFLDGAYGTAVEPPYRATL